MEKSISFDGETNISTKATKDTFSDGTSDIESSEFSTQLQNLSGQNFILKTEYFSNKNLKSFEIKQEEKSIRDLFFEYYLISLKNKPVQKSKIRNQKSKEITPRNCDGEVNESSERKKFSPKKLKLLLQKKTHIKKITNAYKLIEENEKNVDFLLDLVQTHQGCLYYEQRIKKDKDFANNFLYNALKPFMFQLILDSYGNFLYQHFIDVLNESNLYHLLQFILLNFDKISFSTFGTRVIQTLLKKNVLDEAMCDEILEKIKPNVEKMAIDENASYIIQQCLCTFDSNKTRFICMEINKSFLQIADTKYGCCVIEKYILKGDPEQKQILISSILKNTKTLIRRKYGNYLYQFLILYCDDYTISKFYNIIKKDIYDLCQDKYSSNVIEKFFEINNNALGNDIVYCIIANEKKAIGLICNMYGNYIIQKIFDSNVNNFLKHKFLKLIFDNFDKIKEVSFCKKLLTTLTNKYLGIFIKNDFSKF